MRSQPHPPGAQGPRLALGHGLPTWQELEAAALRGEISIKWLSAPGEPDLAILNYTPRAVYDRVWTPVTRVARGLIVCPDTGEVVALPLPKFMNLGEDQGDGTAASPGSGPFDVLVKLDGALGILFRHAGRVRWATRGSFELSTQSQAAQAIWDARYRHHEPLLLGEWHHLTLLAEIIHPTSRVVCRYDFEDLVLIACRDRHSGADLQHEQLLEIAERLGMPVVERVPGDLASIVARSATLDDNQEGFVLRWTDGYRLKVKGAAYKELHRVLSNFTPAQQAAAWYEGRLAEVLPAVPEEFRQEAEAVALELERRSEALRETAEAWFRQAVAAAEGDRGRFARWLQANVPKELHPLLFQRWKLELPEAGPRLATELLARLWKTGRLEALLASPPGSPALADAVGAAERDLADFLWEATRSPDGLVRARAWSSSLPGGLRGAAVAAIEELTPGRAVAQVRALAAQQAAPPELAGLDAERLFAEAPSPECPIYEHLNYVFSQPLVLRVYLDKWRRAGQRETALTAARRVLAAAVQGGEIDALSRGSLSRGSLSRGSLGRGSLGRSSLGRSSLGRGGSETRPGTQQPRTDEWGGSVGEQGGSETRPYGDYGDSRLGTELEALRDALAGLWATAPSGGGSREEAEASLARSGAARPWVAELRRAANDAYRKLAFDQFCAEHAGDRGLAGQLDEA